MKKVFLFGAALTMLAALQSCNSTGSYEKTKSGLMYKIISDKTNPVVENGQFLKIHFEQKLNDSVMYSTVQSLPEYVQIDTMPNPQGEYSPMEVFPMLRKGDSVVIVQITDSLAKRMGGQMPPFMKNGQQLTFNMKVTDVFKSEEEVEADKLKGEEEFKINEVKVLEKHITDKNITAVPAGNGVFVEITAEGMGNVPDSGNTVSVMYTGKLLADGQVFDSNLDTAKNPTQQPLSFVIGQHQMIPGFEQGVKLLKKGAKANIFIPSMQGYGRRPLPNGKGYDNLLFEVEVVDIK